MTILCTRFTELLYLFQRLEEEKNYSRVINPVVELKMANVKLVGTNKVDGKITFSANILTTKLPTHPYSLCLAPS